MRRCNGLDLQRMSVQVDLQVMTAFRPMGVKPGNPCPTCSFPHFPFCLLQQQPSSTPAFPPQLPGPTAGGCRPIHPSPPPHPSYLLSNLRQPISDAVPNGVPKTGHPSISPSVLMGQGHLPLYPARSAVDFELAHRSFVPPPLHHHVSAPFQNSLPHLSNSSAQPQFFECFPESLNPSLSGPPRTRLSGGSKIHVNGWSAEDNSESPSSSKAKAPSMPQWFLDQQRRSTGMVISPNSRSGIGEKLGVEEDFPVPYLSAEAPLVATRDRQGGFSYEGVQEERTRYWNREDMPLAFLDRNGVHKNGAFHRMDGNGVPAASEISIGSQASLDLSNVTVRGPDRVRRMWGIPATDAARDSSVEHGHPSQNSGYASIRQEQRQASVLPGHVQSDRGCLPFHAVRRAEEGRQPTVSALASSREVQLLHEHGLVDNGVEHWDRRGLLPGAVHRSVDSQDVLAHEHLGQRPVNIGTDHANSALGTEMPPTYPHTQHQRRSHSDKLHGAGTLSPEGSNVSGAIPFRGRSGPVGIQSSLLSPTNSAVGVNHGGQSSRTTVVPPALEELDEVFYLKIFPEPADQFCGAHPHHSGGDSNLGPFQARMSDDGRFFQEAASTTGSQNWPVEQLQTGVQDTGHVLPPVAGNRQGLPQLNSQATVQFPSPNPIRQQVYTHEGHNLAHSHEAGRQPPAVYAQKSNRISHALSQLQAQLALQSRFDRQPGLVHTQNYPPDQRQQYTNIQPSGCMQFSDGQQILHPSQVTMSQHQQQQLNHYVAQDMQTQAEQQDVLVLPQSQGPLLDQNQQLALVSDTPRSVHTTQGICEAVAIYGLSVNGISNGGGAGSSQAPVPPDKAHCLSPPEAPPCPLTAPDTPPPLPLSPPQSSPPSQLAPLPVPVQPSPATGQSPVLSPRLPAQILKLEEHFQRANYPHSMYAIQQPPLQGPGFHSMGPQFVHQAPFGNFRNHGHSYTLQQQETPKMVDAVSIFRRPGRLARPERIVVILRGLPGSGKSYLARALRDVELMNGGSAPRIHSLDDYFMTEVEMVEGVECGTKPSNCVSKRRSMKKVMEYCYEPEMEEVYRASMLKAFRKTLEEGMFSFVIVDDRNVLVADFAQFWAIAKRSGYEVYLLESMYRDVTGCAARNVHNFTQDQVQAMAISWERVPAMYLQLDVSSLFRGDVLNSQDITEIEMDADDMECETDDQEDGSGPIAERMFIVSNSTKNASKAATTGDKWENSDGEAEEGRMKPVKRMRFPDDIKYNSDSSGSSNGKDTRKDALSGLMEAYGRKENTVHWADHEDDKDGGGPLSMGSALENVSDLLMGPGPGYNKARNPVPKEYQLLYAGTEHAHQTQKFLEQYRAEQDAFKAEFTNKGHGEGLDDQDDQV